VSTYLRRRGRLTRGQARALADHADRIIPAGFPGPVDWTDRFARPAPLGLEIGFGMGQALLGWSREQPGMNLLGIEVYQPGIGALLHSCAEQGIEHLLVIEDDANESLESLFEPESLEEVRIFFPDPWPKKRHHKRRLVQPAFVALLVSRLESGGRLRLATDWQPYAESMLAFLNAEPLLINDFGAGYADRFDGRPITRFEARGQRLGHEVWDLSFRKSQTP